MRTALLCVFFLSLFCAYGQMDFDLPQKISIEEKPARKKGEITTEFSLGFNVGEGKEINSAWQEYLNKRFGFKIKGLGRNSRGSDLLHSSWGNNIFHLESEVEFQNGLESLFVLLYPVKADRNNDDSNELNDELHFLKEVMRDFAKVFYKQKMEEAIVFQQKIVENDEEALKKLNKQKRNVEKSIDRANNKIVRLDRKKTRLERRIKNMNAQIATSNKTQESERLAIENDTQNLETAEKKIVESQSSLEKSREQLNKLNQKLSSIENL